MTTLYSKLFEGLTFKCLEGLVKPMIHVDEFSSKMGEDADIIVLSFYVRDEQAAGDLANWFETGYQQILDADVSPGEMKPNRYLVYVELRRRTNASRLVHRLLDDLSSLTEFSPDDWQMRYEGTEMPFSVDNFEQIVPLSPQAYRETHEQDLNEMRLQAGLEPRRIYTNMSQDVLDIQSIAGIR